MVNPEEEPQTSIERAKLQPDAERRRRERESVLARQAELVRQFELVRQQPTFDPKIDHLRAAMAAKARGDYDLARLHKAADREVRKELRHQAALIQARNQNYQPYPKFVSQEPFPSVFSAVHTRLAIVLRNFNQTTCACPDMPYDDIVNIILMLNAGKIPDDVLTLITEEYIAEQHEVRMNQQPKFNAYPRLEDVRARCNAVLKINKELGTIVNRKRKPPKSSIRRARL